MNKNPENQNDFKAIIELSFREFPEDSDLMQLSPEEFAIEMERKLEKSGRQNSQKKRGAQNGQPEKITG